MIFINNIKRKIIIIGVSLICILLIIFIFHMNKTGTNDDEITKETISKNYNDQELEKGILTSKDMLELHDVDGNSTNYTFKYNNEKYVAIYTKDNWHIEDSYKIKNKEDIIMICEALIDFHGVLGKDKTSFRTAKDLAKEWLLHNFAYEFLPEGSRFKENAKSVDLNTEDQGKDLIEMYKVRK